MAVILPTHTCFDDTVAYVVGRVSENPRLIDGASLVIVHGILLAPDDAGEDAGTPFAHAWIEESGVVITAGILKGRRIWYAVERAEYYRAMRVQASTAYTIREAEAQEKRTGGYGPWAPEYRALCGHGERRRVFGAVPD